MTDQYAGIQFVHSMFYNPEDGEIRQGPETMGVEEYTEWTQQLKKDNDVCYVHTGRRAYDGPIDYSTLELIARVADGTGDLIPAADPNPAEITRAKQRFAAARRKMKLPEPILPPDMAASGEDKVLVRNVYESTVYADTAVSPDGEIRGRIPRKSKAYVSENEATMLELRDLVVRLAT